jgi:hypothetical protein
MDYLQNKLPGEVKDLGLLSLPVGILGTEAPGSHTVVPEIVCTTLYSPRPYVLRYLSMAVCVLPYSKVPTEYIPS